MAGEEVVIFERARDGEHWRVRTEGGDVEAHGKKWPWFDAEGSGDDVEGHGIKFKGFSAEPVEGEGDDVEGHASIRIKFSDEPDDAEGHAVRGRFKFSDGEDDADDAEGHGFRFPRFKAEPVGEEDGQPVYELDFGDEDTEGHATTRARFSDRRLKRGVRAL